MIDLHSLIYFKKVAELQHLAGLEAELGVKLFDRVGKGIVLNRNGAILLRHTNSVLRELADAQAELADQEAEGNRTVTISLFAASKLLPQLISDFKAEFPSIRLQIIQHDLREQGEGERDIAIFSSVQPAVGENERVLIEEELLLALPEGSPFPTWRRWSSSACIKVRACGPSPTCTARWRAFPPGWCWSATARRRCGN